MAIKNIMVERPTNRTRTSIGGGKSFTMTWRPLNLVVMAEEGQTILEVCEENRIPLEHHCGGNCACSSCRVIVHEGMGALSTIEEDELNQLDDLEDGIEHARLGCQARVCGDTQVGSPTTPQSFATGDHEGTGRQLSFK